MRSQELQSAMMNGVTSSWVAGTMSLKSIVSKKFLVSRNLMPVYAHIRGIPGSGKSWLCKELAERRITCYDTDDLFLESFNILMKTKKFRNEIKGDNWHDRVSRHARRRFGKILTNAKHQGESVVLVGITLGRFRGIHSTYFVRLSGRSLEKAYRRVLHREIAKVVSQHEKLDDIIDEEPRDSLSALLNVNLNQALELDISYKRYHEMYREALSAEIKAGAIVMSQIEIINDVSRITQED